MGDEDVKEYHQRAVALRSEGRWDEAVLVARRATTMAPDDANAWWQLALSLGGEEEGVAAFPALRKVVELAPDYARGWHQLGVTHHGADQLDDAIAAYEVALEMDHDFVPTMRMLAFALKSKKEPDVPARRLALLRGITERSALFGNDLFDFAYLLHDADETAEAVRVYETYTRLNKGKGAYYNLALGYRTLGRDADALDALDAAARDGYDSDNLKSVRAGVQRKLQALRQQVLRKPQPHLPQSEWFQHYINPFTLLNVEPADVTDNPKALQKARQALLREIELEDGKVDWMPGLVIDKSAALALLTELDTPDLWQAHELVYKNKPLVEFLMKGNLEHFLIKEDGSGEATMTHLMDEDILHAISPKFSAQYDLVLSRAAEHEDLHAVECLLDGRRWVTPGEQDACLASTRRLLERRMEPLLNKATECANRTVSKAEIEAAFNQGSLRGLLTHLPIEFHEAHSAVGGALRSLTVSFYNREHDAETAKAILELGRICAQKSSALAHQLEDDEKTLNGFIQEEKAQEAHLAFKDRDVSITKAGVVDGKRKLAASEIAGVRWGQAQTSLQPPMTRYTIAFDARRGPELAISWNSGSNQEQQKHWGGLVDATFAYILPTVMIEFEKQLDAGEYTQVGSLRVRKEGVELMSRGWFTDKKVLVPWCNLSCTLSNGMLNLIDKTTSKVHDSVSVETTYNAILLYYVISRKEAAPS